MNKKTGIAILILAVIFAGGGFLMWQNSQAAVKDLNSSLPEGVRVVKSLFGNEYKVVNKIDGYEFRVPITKDWGKIEKIVYEDLTINPENGSRLSFKQEFQIPIITERLLLILGNKSGDIEIRKLTLEDRWTLQKFAEDLGSGFVSKLQTERNKIIPIVDTLKDEEKNILKLSIKLQHVNAEAQPFLEYILFGGDTGTYILNGSSIEENDQLTRDIVSNGKW